MTSIIDQSSHEKHSMDNEYAHDPASGGFFSSDYKKHDDLKMMLDVNKDALKLEAMKRIIGMIARGKDASDLFPAVVKNVVSKNIEVKKLVYVYLVRYAEEQQDLALLSISSFQRALKDPNQLIRGSALRILSSIRVSVIVPIVMLAIRDASSDMSPYVRKTAAHAIPKLYLLDNEQKDELVSIIDKLLSDKTTMVVGSAVMAFEQVCPEKIDLIHKNYRKLCNLLVDIDEWGQVFVINMLTRYARTQFLDPNIRVNDDKRSNHKERANSTNSDNGIESDAEENYSILDPDHKLLLKNSRPLLQSRNTAVVMSVAQLYHYLAPRSEVMVVAKSLVRLLRSHREVQSLVLNSIASISVTRKAMFQPFLKSFFVRTNDVTSIKVLKLEIMTNLAADSNITIILREFQTYICSNDKALIGASIQAIGRCASDISVVRENCLENLVSLLSNTDECTVAESIIVIRKLLQVRPEKHIDVIARMAKLVDRITVPQARASILWLFGEFSSFVPKTAADVLRKMAKSFSNEEEIVKLQIINLCVKLNATNRAQTAAITEYIFTMARYDRSYDVRDRTRFLRPFLKDNTLSERAKEIFLSVKPAPALKSKFIDRDEFQMGSLSHYINSKAIGYQELPPFPPVPADSSVRKSCSESNELSTSDVSDSNGDSGSETSKDGDNDSNDDDDDEDDDDSNDNQKKESSDESYEYSESGDSSNDNYSSNDENNTSDNDASAADTETDSQDLGQHIETEKDWNKTSADDLGFILDSDKGFDNVLPGSLPSPIVMKTTNSSLASGMQQQIQAVNATLIPTSEYPLLSKIASYGCMEVKYRFTRDRLTCASDNLVPVLLTFVNLHSKLLSDIDIAPKNDNHCGYEFSSIKELRSGETHRRILGVDFHDTTQPITFQVKWVATEEGDGSAMKVACVTVQPPIGELIMAVTMPEAFFISEQQKLKGMNQHVIEEELIEDQDEKNLSMLVFGIANFGSVPSSDSTVLRFAGKTTSRKSLVLATIKTTICDSNPPLASLTVNCENMVLASMMFDLLRTTIFRSKDKG